MMTDWLTHPLFLIVWAVLVLACEIALIRDLRRNNANMAGLMKLVWVLTVFYSGFLGLAVYFYAGRAQIPRDSLARRGWRSTAHCYSGCGMGEMVGVVLASLLALKLGATVALTFSLAYLAGLALTVGPLMQEGMAFGIALKDAVISESASIVVMEAVAIGVDIWLAGDATIAEPLFWAALVVSLNAGLLAAWPVNVLLVRLGVKEGMSAPQPA